MSVITLKDQCGQRHLWSLVRSTLMKSNVPTHWTAGNNHLCTNNNLAAVHSQFSLLGDVTVAFHPLRSCFICRRVCHIRPIIRKRRAIYATGHPSRSVNCGRYAENFSFLPPPLPIKRRWLRLFHNSILCTFTTVGKWYSIHRHVFPQPKQSSAVNLWKWSDPQRTGQCGTFSN